MRESLLFLSSTLFKRKALVSSASPFQRGLILPQFPLPPTFVSCFVGNRIWVGGSSRTGFWPDWVGHCRGLEWSHLVPSSFCCSEFLSLLNTHTYMSQGLWALPGEAAQPGKLEQMASLQLGFKKHVSCYSRRFTDTHAQRRKEKKKQSCWLALTL